MNKKIDKFTTLHQNYPNLDEAIKALGEHVTSDQFHGDESFLVNITHEGQKPTKEEIKFEAWCLDQDNTPQP
jgi:hypothetical protein